MMLPTSLRAQVPDTLWFEDFSDSAAWANSWTVYPYISDSTVVFYRIQGHNTIVLYGATSNMTTPEITIPAEATDYSFICDLHGESMYAVYDYVGGYEITIVDVNDPSNEVVLVDGLTDFADDDPGHRIVSLADWAGKTVQITFTFGNDQYLGSYLMISKVAIRTADKPLYNITLPSGTTAYTGRNNQLIAQYLEGSLTDMQLSWTSKIGTIIDADNDTTSVIYTQGGLDTIIFTASNSYGTFVDTILMTVVSCDPVTSFPWTEDFEDGPDPCFTFIDNDGDGFNWVYYNGATMMTHSGNGIMYSESYSHNTGALSPDNWMITPALTLPDDASGFILSWWAAGQDQSYFSEHYSVYVSNGNTVNDFTSAPIYEGVTTHDMTRHYISLAEYAGQTIYIAFRHHDIIDMYRLNIDDIFVGVDSTVITFNISGSANYPERGTVTGTGSYNNLSVCTISANANYGYHFTGWDDGNTDNPRTITLTQDTQFVAMFDKNIYTLEFQSNNSSIGVVDTTSVSGEYLDTVLIHATAIPHHHFVRWSDYNTDTHGALCSTTTAAIRRISPLTCI